jgi:type III secretion system needle length determinant
MTPDPFNPISSNIPAFGAGERPATQEHKTSDESKRDLEGDSRQFEHAMGEKKTAKDSHDDASSSEHSQKEGEAAPGDALLQSLFGIPAPLQKQEASPLLSPLTPQPAPESKLADIAAQVAERVLVSDPAAGTDSEVRIIIKESILPQTEIRITRAAGELQIRIVTESQEVSNQLTPQQGALQSLLQERLPRETVRVEVDFGGAAEDESERGTRNPRHVWEEEEQKPS